MSEQESGRGPVVVDYRFLLANERTFLAYMRTALSLLAGGAVLLQFFSEKIAVIVSGWALIVLGGMVLLFGLARFIRVRSDLKSTRT